MLEKSKLAKIQHMGNSLMSNVTFVRIQSEKNIRLYLILKKGETYS